MDSHVKTYHAEEEMDSHLNSHPTSWRNSAVPDLEMSYVDEGFVTFSSINTTNAKSPRDAVIVDIISDVIPDAHVDPPQFPDKVQENVHSFTSQVYGLESSSARSSYLRKFNCVDDDVAASPMLSTNPGDDPLIVGEMDAVVTGVRSKVSATPSKDQAQPVVFNEARSFSSNEMAGDADSDCEYIASMARKDDSRFDSHSYFFMEENNSQSFQCKAIVDSDSPSKKIVYLDSPIKKRIASDSPNKETIDSVSLIKEKVDSYSPSKETVVLDSPSKETVASYSPSKESVYSVSPSKSIAVNNEVYLSEDECSYNNEMSQSRTDWEELDEEELEVDIIDVDPAYDSNSNSNESSGVEFQVIAYQRSLSKRPTTPSVEAALTSSSTDTASEGEETDDFMFDFVEPFNIQQEMVHPVENELSNSKVVHHSGGFPKLPVRLDKTGLVVNKECRIISHTDSEKNAPGIKIPDFISQRSQSKSDFQENTNGRSSLLRQALNETLLHCRLCLKSCESELSLKKHLLWHLLIKNTGEKKLLDDSAADEFNLKLISNKFDIRNLTFVQLLSECRQKVRSLDGIHCLHCQRNFEFHYDLKLRMELVDIKCTHTCARCSETFDNNLSLDIHLRQHFGSKPFGCCCCDQIFSDIGDLKSHLLIHVIHPYTKLFKCQYCPKMNFSEIEKTMHQSEHLQLSHSMSLVWEIKSKIYSLDGIQSDFKVSKFRKMLPECKSAVEVMESISNYRKQDTTLTSNEEGLLHAELQALTSINNLSKGLIDVLEEKSEPIQPEVSAIIIKDLEAESVVCRQVLSSAYGSILENLDKRKSWCRYCGMSFSHTSDLLLSVHKEACHKAPKLYLCSVCHGYFDSLKALSEHRIIHGEENFSLCPVCFQEFQCQVDMSQHLKIHFADRLQRCPECGLTFKLKSEFVEHLQTHSELSTFLYDCKDCKSVFTNRMLLRKHRKRRHVNRSGFKCFICGMQFSKQNVGLLHVKAHLRNKFRKCLKGMDLYKPLSSQSNVSKLSSTCLT